LLPPAECRFFNLTQRYWNRACPRHAIIFSRSDALPRLGENATSALMPENKIPAANSNPASFCLFQRRKHFF
jgi:hypothetical protein